MNAPPLDHARLARLERLGGRALVVEMIATFLAAAPGRRAALEGALAAKDPATLADAAHAIVAGAGQLGATILMEQARQVEEAVRAGEAPAAFTATSALLSTFDTALAALGRILEAR